MIGLVFATRREAQPFFDQVRHHDCNEATQRVYRTHAFGRPVLTMLSGMGPQKAAEAVTHLIERHDVDKVLNAGICGAIDGNLTVGDLFWVSQARHADTPDGPQSFSCHFLESLPLPRARLITSQVPVFDPAQKEGFVDWAQLVDMEGAAIAEQCQAQGVPCLMLKGITDMADAEGKQSIADHMDEVAKRIAGVLVSVLLKLHEPNFNEGS